MAGMNEIYVEMGRLVMLVMWGFMIWVAWSQA
jgi:hypothetical protein